MKNDMLKQILQLTLKDKYKGIWIDHINQKIYIGHVNKPKNFTGEYKEWWSNGQLFVHCFFEYGLKHGEYKKWYESGQVYAFSFYKKGKFIKKLLNEK